jgi:hypothetical protein
MEGRFCFRFVSTQEVRVEEAGEVFGTSYYFVEYLKLVQYVDTCRYAVWKQFQQYARRASVASSLDVLMDENH